MKYKYFVAYSELKLYGCWVENIVIDLDKPIQTIKDIREAEKLIAKIQMVSSKMLYIVNWKELPNESNND